MNKVFFTINNCKNEEYRLKRVDEYINSLALELDCEILNYLDVGMSFFINDYWNINDYPDDNFDEAMKIDVLLHIEEELKYKITENDEKDLPFPKIRYINTLEKIKRKAVIL